jgi:hypothetical protein
VAQRWRSTPYALVAVGFLVLFVSGSAAGRYTPGWFDPDDALPCRCSPEEAASALTALWVWVGVGSALVLGGVLLFSLGVDRTPRRPAGPLPAPAHALVAGMVGFVLPAALFMPVLFLVILSDHLVPAAVLLALLVHAAAMSGVDRAIGPAWSSPRRSWLTGLAAGAIGSGAAWALLFAEPTADDDWMPAVVDAAAVALVVLAGRTLFAPRSGRTRPGLAVGAVAALAGAALLVVSVAVPDLLLPRPWHPAVAAPAAAVPAVPTTEPPALPTTSAPVPAPASTTRPPLVGADVPCDQADLAFVVTGWDAAMGARFASVQATNTGDAACWVEGVPSVTLLQGGHPLQLTLEPGQMGDGSPVVVQQVGIAPGGHAYALLDWRTYAGWADDTTPQSVTVALTTGTAPLPAGIVGGHGPAPFDLADGGSWGVGPWAPPWN